MSIVSSVRYVAHGSEIKDARRNSHSETAVAKPSVLNDEMIGRVLSLAYRTCVLRCMYIEALNAWTRNRNPCDQLSTLHKLRVSLVKKRVHVVTKHIYCVVSDKHGFLPHTSETSPCIPLEVRGCMH